ADQPILENRFAGMGAVKVNEVLASIRKSIPIFSGLNPLLLRETMLESKVHVLKKGDIIFERNDYSDTFFTVFRGTVGIQINRSNPDLLVKLGEGEFFGEMGLISGRRRTATVL